MPLPHLQCTYCRTPANETVANLGQLAPCPGCGSPLQVEVFPALSLHKNARERIVSASELIAAAPDIIVGSWCGKKFVPEKAAARPGFDVIPAVRDGFLREIKSPLILQPGPAALTDGLDALAGIIAEWAASR